MLIYLSAWLAAKGDLLHDLALGVLPFVSMVGIVGALVVLEPDLGTALVIAAILPAFRRNLERLYRAEGERQAMLVETIHGMRTVKALALEPTQRRVWDERTAQAVATRFSVGRVSIRPLPSNTQARSASSREA